MQKRINNPKHCQSQVSKKCHHARVRYGLTPVPTQCRHQRKLLSMPEARCWDTPVPSHITRWHTCQGAGISSLTLQRETSKHQQKPQDRYRWVLYLKDLSHPEAELVCRSHQQQSQHLSTFAESYPCEFPQQRCRLILAVAQDYELISDHTWKGTSCPLNICLALPDSSTCVYTQPHSHRKTSPAQQYLPRAELEEQQQPC